MAQENLIQATVQDQQRNPIIGAHVRNISSNKITVTNQDGAFQINGSSGDTLVITSMGFREIIVEVSTEWSEEKLLFMRQGSVELNEISVFSIPPIEEFKEKIKETKVPDSSFFWYYGVDKPVMRGDKMAEGRIHKKLLYAVFQPTSFLYYNLSKAEKEKRAVHEIKSQAADVEKSEMKFTREWVAEHTGYLEDELTSFIGFCSYSPQYLAKTPLYLVMEDMLIKKKEFEKQKEK